MATAKRESLPDTQMGLRETSNVRMKVMAAPRCPVSEDENSPDYTGEINCQRETGNWPGWWTLCENRGHDPYYTTKKRIVKEEVTDETGLITGERKRVITQKKLNTVQVPIGTRFTSGRAETISKGLKGRKTLTEMGYNEKCEFRNCENDVKLTSKYGFFCSDRHARLIGADVEGVMLSVKKGEKAKQLRDIDPDFEGVIVIQEPPDLDSM